MGVSRRAFLKGGFALGAASAAGAALSACDNQPEHTTGDGAQEKAQLVGFDGPHQAGISTEAQTTLNLVGFNVLAQTDPTSIRNLLRLWTEDARALCSGRNPVGSLEPELSENPANMTITCGFGPRLFEILGHDIPEILSPIPSFSKDQLDPTWGQTDLALQICGNDAVTVAHATRHMIRSAVDYVAVEWIQQGFNEPAERGTPRNLFGLKDGTVNPRDQRDYDDVVWIDQGPQWQRGGTVMVVRRIAMNLDTWEQLDRTSRETAFGRALDTGAPLSGTEEFDAPDFRATDGTGLPVIDPMSHMARATIPRGKPEQQIRRRAYNYDLPPTSQTLAGGQTSNSGLVFICFQKDHRKQFSPIQQRLDEGDRINQWITHIGSALYFCPPGTQQGKYWGQELLG